MSEHERSHLDIESPLFRHPDRPHLWIQWKGTNVCCDIHCQCGAFLHFDGDFFYCFQCPHCGQFWECGTHIPLYAITQEQAEKRGCIQVVEPDEDNEQRPKS